MKIPNNVKWLAFAVIGLLALVFLMRSCRLYDENSVLKGKHEALQVAYADLDMKSADVIEEKDKVIAEKDKAIAKKDEQIAKIYSALHYKDEAIEKLEAEYTNLGENKDAKIQNLQAQVAVWKEKFTLAEAVIAEKDGIIFDLTAKYEAQIRISGEWKASYDRQVALNSLALARISGLEREWRGLRFGSRLKTYVIVAVGAGFVYSLVSK